MLHFFTKNPFAGSKFSASKFDKLVKAHLASLKVANQDGSFTDLHHDTLALYTEFTKQVASKSSSNSTKKGSTENADTMADTVKAFIAEQEPNIQYQFRKEAGKYAEFFPGGLTEYRRAGKDTLVTLFNRFVTACEPHGDRLGKDVIKQAQQLRDQWQQVRNGQVQTKQTTKNLTGTALTSQQALAVRLYRTLGVLVSRYAEQPEKIHQFFDFSFLPKSTPRSPKKPKAEIKLTAKDIAA